MLTVLQCFFAADFRCCCCCCPIIATVSVGPARRRQNWCLVRTRTWETNRAAELCVIMQIRWGAKELKSEFPSHMIVIIKYHHVCLGFVPKCLDMIETYSHHISLVGGLAHFLFSISYMGCRPSH